MSGMVLLDRNSRGQNIVSGFDSLENKNRTVQRRAWTSPWRVFSLRHQFDYWFVPKRRSKHKPAWPRLARTDQGPFLLDPVKRLMEGSCLPQ